MHISAALAIRRPASRAAYLAKAQDTWTWLANSGIRNSDNIWQDGRRYHSDTDSCTTDVGIFLYTQGVIASGLGVLYAATKDANYLTEAEKTIDGVIRTKTLNGVLFENCDLDPNNPCDHNNQEYKGIFLKHLMYYLDQANDPARTAKYAPFLAKQSNAVRSIATNGAGDPGSLWCQAPTDALKSITSTWSVASGLAAHYVAAKYSPC
ncbi:glycoside hydrolase family 76 protein [Mycena filopes]|nr:glycoside hydrolase family 76 protein [Mycena filopes]